MPKCAFLSGYLEKEVYFEQLREFIKKGGEDKILKRNKAFFDMGQSSKTYNKRLMTSSNTLAIPCAQQSIKSMSKV